MTKSEKVGEAPDTDDDEPNRNQSSDTLDDLTPDYTYEVAVPVAVPPEVEQEARAAADDRGSRFEDELRSRVSFVPEWVLSDEERREVVHVRLPSETRAKLDAVSSGESEAWLRGAITRQLDRAAVALGGPAGQTLTGPSGVPAEDRPDEDAEPEG